MRLHNVSPHKNQKENYIYEQYVYKIDSLMLPGIVNLTAHVKSFQHENNRDHQLHCSNDKQDSASLAAANRWQMQKEKRLAEYKGLCRSHCHLCSL